MTHAPLVRVPETALSWIPVPGCRDLCTPVNRKNKGSLPLECCSFAGRLNIRSASSSVFEGWWIATSSWFVCWVTEWREIYLLVLLFLVVVVPRLKKDQEERTYLWLESVFQVVTA